MLASFNLFLVKQVGISALVVVDPFGKWLVGDSLDPLVAQKDPSKFPLKTQGPQVRILHEVKIPPMALKEGKTINTGTQAK